ncbi:MAG: hypothetical protein WC662_04975 [Candidatus Paceibacterota bacterium]|jgi:hypothetical protein
MKKMLNPTQIKTVTFQKSFKKDPAKPFPNKILSFTNINSVTQANNELDTFFGEFDINPSN